MRKALAAAALVLLLVAGAVVGYVLYKRHEARNIRGSSTQEFVTTEAPKPVHRTPAIVWPTYGYDAERVKAGAEPDIRKVMVGSRRVPYWQGGRAYQPYAAGYFGGFGMMDMMFMIHTKKKIDIRKGMYLSPFLPITSRAMPRAMKL